MPMGLQSFHNLLLVRADSFWMNIIAAKEARALHEGSLCICSAYVCAGCSLSSNTKKKRQARKRGLKTEGPQSVIDSMQHPVPSLPSHTVGFLSLSTSGIWAWIIVGCGGLSWSLWDVDVPIVTSMPRLTTKKYLQTLLSVPSVKIVPLENLCHRGCSVNGPYLLNPDTQQNATRVVHLFSYPDFSSCCLVGNWQQGWPWELQATLIRLRGGLRGMAQTLLCSPAAFLAPYVVFQVQTPELVPAWLTGALTD